MRRVQGIRLFRVRQVQLQVLRSQVAYEHRLAQQGCRRRTFAEIRRQSARAGDDPVSRIGRHQCGIGQGVGLPGFLDIEQTELRIVVTNGQQSGIARLTQRVGTLDPEGGIQHADMVVVARVQVQDDPPGLR
ncbi:hypothetical protein ABI_28930 [Asticcacaulis biprosthecium C19]|uniref:Uncharacterized protein n=1 Tax=Asticcacaulis biprosthecium C19 TaxID=715226 RepID=F4QMN5_9CAUL|nr:hypothetical protein ABI_28930 [Asticcacaulis biprosthecium C19]